MTTQSITRISFPKIANPFRWLVRLDAAYRSYLSLKEAENHRLEDMGISRKQLDQAFYRQFAEKSYH